MYAPDIISHLSRCETLSHIAVWEKIDGSSIVELPRVNLKFRVSGESLNYNGYTLIRDIKTHGLCKALAPYPTALALANMVGEVRCVPLQTRIRCFLSHP